MPGRDRVRGRRGCKLRGTPAAVRATLTLMTVSDADAGGRRPPRWWVALLIIATLGLAGAASIGGRWADPATAPTTPPPATPPPAFRPLADPPSGAPAPVASVDPLVLGGPVPEHGTGRFDFAGGRGPVLGGRGPVLRFRVAVERGSGEHVADFAALVQATLGDQRGWIGDRRRRFQRVSGSGHESANFVVYLATRDTADRMCAAGGTSVRIKGRVFTSCRVPGAAIINLDRWRLSAPPYVRARIPLSVYRQYVINHEVGHELGYGHEGCPKLGSPAPVMVQQTLNLRGCVPYAWPRYAGRDLTGPPVS